MKETDTHMYTSPKVRTAAAWHRHHPSFRRPPDSGPDSGLWNARNGAVLAADTCSAAVQNYHPTARCGGARCPPLARIIPCITFETPRFVASKTHTTLH